jgi:quercetin dioxygenase-like cupin family protein
MAGVEVKNKTQPDETRPFADKGEGHLVNVGGHSVMYGTMQPGWRWSEHIKPVAGTEKCEATHLLYCFSGRMKVVHNDGTEAEIGPGDIAVIEPGHDAWIVGDEPFESIDFGGYAQYAKPS